LLFISPDQLGRNVLRIGGAAAISTKQDLIAGPECLADKAAGRGNLGESGVEQCLYRFQMLFERTGQNWVLRCQGIAFRFEVPSSKFNSTAKQGQS